jgi:hypothetical protein
LPAAHGIVVLLVMCCESACIGCFEACRQVPFLVIHVARVPVIRFFDRTGD